MTSSPWSTTARCTTERMTAFRPGQSPPEVSTPMRIARNTFTTWAVSRTTSSGRAPAPVPAPGDGTEPDVRLMDVSFPSAGLSVGQLLSGGLGGGGDALGAQRL